MLSVIRQEGSKAKTIRQYLSRRSEIARSNRRNNSKQSDSLIPGIDDQPIFSFLNSFYILIYFKI